MLPFVFFRPHIGVLLWCWTAILVPNTFLFGFGSAVRFNLIVATVTVLAWWSSGEPKKISVNSTSVLIVIFLLLGTLSSVFNITHGDVVWEEWGKFVKVLVFPFFIIPLINSENRIKALLFAIVLSLGFHGVSGGLKFILSLGAHRVWGPPNSIIGDNNHFALAIVVSMPILYFLATQTENRLLKLIIGFAALVQLATVMGTNSRGGFIGVLALAFFAFSRTKNKLSFALFTVVIASSAIFLAPQNYFDRIETIQSADDDVSFMGRVIAWKQSTLIALDHPLLGGGFHAVQDLNVWLYYANIFGRLDFIPTPFPNDYRAFAAHSIYFQVLGDMGFLALGVFISLFVVAWRNTVYVIKNAENRPSLAWNRNLAKTIQYCLVPYMVSGAALNMAYFDLLYIILALAATLRQQVQASLLQSRT